MEQIENPHAEQKKQPASGVNLILHSGQIL
jgi:hypothetical protein